jgi:hypothetical protein
LAEPSAGHRCGRAPPRRPPCVLGSARCLRACGERTAGAMAQTKRCTFPAVRWCLIYTWSIACLVSGLVDVFIGGLIRRHGRCVHTSAYTDRCHWWVTNPAHSRYNHVVIRWTERLRFGTNGLLHLGLDRNLVVRSVYLPSTSDPMT